MSKKPNCIHPFVITFETFLLNYNDLLYLEITCQILMYKQIKVCPYDFEVKLKVDPKGYVMKIWKKIRINLFPLPEFGSFVLIFLFLKKKLYNNLEVLLACIFCMIYVIEILLDFLNMTKMVEFKIKLIQTSMH
jgi:hypothetical protein